MDVEPTSEEHGPRIPTGMDLLPAGWSWKRLTSVCSGIYDCPHSTPQLTAEGPYVARTQDIITGIFRTDSAAHVSWDTYQERIKRAEPHHGDLLYSREGTYFGIAAEVPAHVQVCLGQRMVLIRPDAGKVDHRFLRYWLNSPAMAAHVHGQRDGSVAERLNLPTIRNLPVLLPTIEEQRAIASILGSLDDKIAVNEGIAATSRELGLALFAQALLDEDPLEAPVESVASTLTRGVAPKYSESSDDLIVLNQKCVRGGRVNLEPARLTLREKVKAPKLLLPNDVLVNSTGVGTLGRVARWTCEIDATVDSHITIVRFDASKVDPVCAGFAMLQAQPEIEALGEGSTGQTELSRSQLGSLEIILPSPVRQRELRKKLDSLEEQADHAIAESAALAKLRDTLLPQLMSGRLRVRDAEKIVEDEV